MTDKKISQLVAVTSVDDADEFVLARSGTSNKITGANLASISPLLFATHTITAADWAAFAANSTPFNGGYGFTVIESPGSGYYIYPVAASLELVAGLTETPYNVGAISDSALQLGTPSMNDNSRAWFQCKQSILQTTPGSGVTAMFADDGDIANQPVVEQDWVEDTPLVLILSTSTPTGGDGDLRVDVYYRVKTFA